MNFLWMYMLIHYSSSPGANLLIFLNFTPYFIKMNGTGIARVATAPRIDIAGPTPRVVNIGLAARGNPAAKTDLKNVFAETALAAYIEYVSTRKLIHCWKIMLKPAPIKTAARMGAIPSEFVSTSKFNEGFGDTNNVYLAVQSTQTRTTRWQKGSPQKPSAPIWLQAQGVHWLHLRF